MNTYLCPLCHFKSGTEIGPYKAKTDLFKNRNIIKCSKCSLFSAFPMLSDSELADYYTKYWQQYDMDTLFPFLKAQAKSRYNFMEPFLPSERQIDILDVGSGYGLIRNCFDKEHHSITYDAIEVDRDAIDYLNQYISPRDIYSCIDQCNKMYNLIIASHILEHYNNINVILENIKSKLINSGLLMIEVPNKDFLFKPHNEPHVIFFSPETLRQFLEKSNYQVVRIDTCGERISTLAYQNTISPRKGIKNIISRISLPAIRVFFQNLGTNRREYGYVNRYGGERQWIRALAKKSNNYPDNRT